MRLGTHLLAGWAVANGVELLPGAGLDAHGRRLTVAASLVPFLDGIPILWNYRRFQEVHHEYTCSLVVGAGVAVLLGLFGGRGRRLRTGAACALAFTFNAVADMFTTNWPVRLFFPLSEFRWAVGGLLSDFVIYRLIGTACDLLFIGLAAAIYLRRRRTPFELVGRRFDALVIDFVRLPWRHRCVECGRRATYRCRGCSATLCGYHVHLRGLRPWCADCRQHKSSSGGNDGEDRPGGDAAGSAANGGPTPLSGPHRG